MIWLAAKWALTLVVSIWLFAASVEALCEYGWKAGQYYLMVIMFAVIIGLAWMFQ
jgi:hypothetical protein